MWRNTITGDQVEADEESCSLAADKRQPVIVIIQRSLFLRTESSLLLRGLHGWRSRGSRRLRLHRLRLHSLQHRLRAAMPRRVDWEGNRGHQEQYSRPRGRSRKRAGRAPRTERRLAALPAKCRGNVSALAALQQHHYDDEETNKNVNGND